MICGRVVWFYNDLCCEFMNPPELPFLSLFIVKIIELFMLHEYSVWNCGACQVGLMVGDAETKLWRIWPGWKQAQASPAGNGLEIGTAQHGLEIGTTTISAG